MTNSFGFIEKDITVFFSQEYIDKIIEMIPAWNFGKHKDLVKTAIFLLSDVIKCVILPIKKLKFEYSHGIFDSKDVNFIGAQTVFSF